MSLSLDIEARLYTTNAERERYDQLATLFGIITTLEYLERAYVRDAVPPAEYSPACARLLSQYKTMFKLVEDNVRSLNEFMARYRVSHACLYILRILFTDGELTVHFTFR